MTRASASAVSYSIDNLAPRTYQLPDAYSKNNLTLWLLQSSDGIKQVHMHCCWCWR